MKRGALVIALSLFTANGVAADWREVRLASEGAFPPFNSVSSNGNLTGLDIDIGNAICAEMKLTCTWVKQERDGLIPGLIARKYDAVVASMAITDERKQKVDFSNKYYASPLALVGKSEIPIKLDATSLKGRKIAVQRGTTADSYATKFWSKHGVVVTRHVRLTEVYAELTAGRVDLVLADYWEAKGGFLNTPAGRDYSALDGRIYGRTSEERAVIGDGVGIAIRKQDRELRELLNKGIAVIRASGTYSEIVQKYFIEDIYGN